MNDSLYNYLVNNCHGSVKVLDNGVYQVNTGQYQLYIPPTASKDVNLVVYYSGGDGARSDLTRGLRGHMTDGTPSDYVTIIANQTDDSGHVLDVATQILNDNGYNIATLVTTSNSASGGLGISRTADYLVQHPELANSTLILCNDGYYMNQVGNNAQVLIQNQVPIVMLAPDHSVNAGGSDRVRAFNESLSQKGFNVYQLESKDYVHDIICTYAYTNGIPEYVLGLQDQLGTKGSHCAPEYVLYKYNPQTGQYEVANMEDMKIASSFNDIGTNLIDPATYRDVGAYKLDTSLGTGKTTNLASDMGVVMSAMNDLSSVVKSNSFEKATNGCSSTVPVMGLMYDSQNYLFGVSSTLADNIGKESAVIANIAQAIYNMDVKLSQSTNGLNDPVNAQRVNATLDKILQSDLTIPYSSFASPVTFEKTTQGNAGKLCMSDIKAMLSGGKLTGPLAKGFETDNNDTKKTIESIKSFQETIASNALQGDIWKEVNDKLDNYNNLLDKRLASNEKLQSAYEEALKLLEDYMGDYDELDDAKIPELKEQVQQLEAEIQKLQEQIDEMKTVCSKDDKGNEECHEEHVYSASQRAAFAEQIKANEALIEELNKEIEKLEGLWEVINQASDIINNTVEEIKADYGKAVEDVAVAEPENVLASTENTPVLGANTALGSAAGAAAAGAAAGAGYGGGGGDYGGGGYSGGGGGYSGGGGLSSSTQRIPTQNTVVTNTPVTNQVISNTPQANTPMTNAPQTNTPTNNTPQSNEPQVINNYYHKNNGGGGGGGISYSEEPTLIPTDEEVIPEEDIIIEEIPIEEEPVLEASIVEEAPLEETIIDEGNAGEVILGQTQVIESTAADQRKNSALRTLGVLTGVGLAAGAAAYAAKEMKKSNEQAGDDYESETDYTYDTGNGYY